MKNVHILPTDKLSVLGRFIDTNNLFLRVSNDIPRGENVNIYITSDEEIKEGVDEIFKENSELSKIGTEQEYSAYLDTIFPDSKVKDIVYHGSPKTKLEKIEGISFWTNEIGNAYAYNIERNEDNSEGFVTSAIINIKNPHIHQEDRNSRFATTTPKDLIDTAKSKNADGAIWKDVEDIGGRETQTVVFEPEQIHILGSKQDIEGFKNWVDEFNRGKYLQLASDEKIKNRDWCLYNKNHNSRNPDWILTKCGEIESEEMHPISEGKLLLWMKKIILTTDQDLIEDGVQATDDEFLEWFVKNPSCEQVDVEIICGVCGVEGREDEIDVCGRSKECARGWISDKYKIIVPKEEAKTNLEKFLFPELVKELAEYYKNIPLLEKRKEQPKQETLEVMKKEQTVEQASEYYAHNYFDMHETNNYQALKQGFINGAKWQQEQEQNNENSWFNEYQKVEDYIIKRIGDKFLEATPEKYNTASEATIALLENNWQQEQNKNLYSEEDLREAFKQGEQSINYSETYGLDSELTEQPQLVKASFEFSQEAHCNSTTDDYESLVIECESSLGIDGDGGCFYVLKTEQWSVNDEKDLKELFDRIQNVIKK